jgi:hypothetical protein
MIDNVTELIAALDERRADFLIGMAGYLTDHDLPLLSNEPRRAAGALLDLLIAALRDDRLSGGGALIALHASRFGDGLSPVLRDTLGADLDDRMIALCVDRFWHALRPAQTA